MTFERKPKIAPSILSANFANLESDIVQLDPQYTDYIHVDVMDGHFVPNITMGPVVVEAVHKITSIPLDVHLMIEKPENFVKEFINAGASIVTVHAEACPHLHRVLQQIKQLGAKAGVSLNPGTPLHAIENVLPDLDMVLLMTVNPGFGGQKFIPQMMDKIKNCREMIEDYPIDLEVDGGVKLENIDKLHKAGANVFVSGSGIFNYPPYNEMMKRMKDKLWST
jgi:ribulose-phosphate 3-epimerase